MKTVVVPTQKECFDLQERMCLPKIVRRHSDQVAKVADFFSGQLVKAKIPVNREIVYAAALLHDLFKPLDFIHKPGLTDITDEEKRFWEGMKAKMGNIHHAEAAYLNLKSKYPEVAVVIRHHNWDFFRKKDHVLSWEDKILLYSDNMVDFDKIVSRKTRIASLEKRYKQVFEKEVKEHGTSSINLAKKVLADIEKQMKLYIPYNPEQIIEMLNKE